MSRSFSSLGSFPDSSGSDLSSPTAASEAQSARLQLILQKHLSADRLKESPLEQYHKSQFIDHIDAIVQKWMVETIFELKQFAEKQLTAEVENTMIESLRSLITQHFPVPTTDEEISKLKALYQDFSGNSEQPNVLPAFYYKAYYLPGGMVPENSTVASIYTALRPKFEEALRQLWRLTYAIHLLVPTMADSHNTGVVVQKKILSCIKAMKSSINGFLLTYGWLNYSKNRCFYLRSIARLPQSVDLRQAYFGFEHTNFRYIRSTVSDLAKELLVLQHLIMQHIEFVKKPRQDHTSNLAAKIIN